jgi:hypothetical protein
MFYLQGSSAIHTIVFSMGASGRDPTIAQHRVTGGLLAYLTSSIGENDHPSVINGWKGLCHNTDIREGNSEASIVNSNEDGKDFGWYK